MRILLSASDITNATNGLARSARDFCAGLRARGHEVRVISYGDSSHVDYPLERLSIPFLDRYIRITKKVIPSARISASWGNHSLRAAKL